MLTWEQAKRYHPNQRGIHQRRGEVISILARFTGDDRKYHDQLLAEDLMLYIGEGDLSAGPQRDTPGNRALKRAKETGAVFPVIVKWERNQYEYLCKWRVIDWEYSPWQGLPAHFRFLLQRVEAPEIQPARFQAVLSAQDWEQARRISTVLEWIVRDTAVIQELKAPYRYTCQVRQQPLNRGCDPLVEGHHIRPLGQPHNGPDIPANVIIVCPNHHALFDCGALSIDLATKQVIHADPTDALIGAPLALRHEIGEEYVRYHNEHIFKGRLS